MVHRNEHIAKLQAGYLFPEIGRRRRAFLAQTPDAQIISLGIGNTTEPLTPHIVEAMKDAVIGLGTPEGYSGYDDDDRAQVLLKRLQTRIAETWYGGAVSADEILVSDGAKPDCGRLQMRFGPDVTVAIQDPAYPVYV
ncbi:MAG TPA: LL-diaminopimelate aminotransferase, partial [Phycisphaerales bacterium]|nr:LL-diaminopimelate aminotransferase [Phycisphaerales bacterium]